MVLQGLLFDGVTSASKKIEADVDDEGLISVRDMESQTILLQAPFTEIKISSRIGNTPRYIYFQKGQKIETRAHDVLDHWMAAHSQSTSHNLLHLLESHLKFVALSLVLLVVMTWATIVYGIPAASRTLAFMMPAKVMNQAAKETLAFLDKTHLGHSQLSSEVRQRVLAHFEPALEENKSLQVKVIFRHGNDIGANAFALPDGTIIFTDEIVELAKNDDELLSVLAHEIGHVKYRHALRAAIQGSVVSFGVVMLTGDVSTVSHLLTTIPIILVNMSYSRDFEREADDNSLAYLNSHQIPRHSFIDLMERLTNHARCQHWLMEEYFDQHEDDKKMTQKKKEGTSDPDFGRLYDDERFNPETHAAQCVALMEKHKNDNSKIMGYFASHPETPERVSKFKDDQPQ